MSSLSNAGVSLAIILVVALVVIVTALQRDRQGARRFAAASDPDAIRCFAYLKVSLALKSNRAPLRARIRSGVVTFFTGGLAAGSLSFTESHVCWQSWRLARLAGIDNMTVDWAKIAEIRVGSDPLRRDRGRVGLVLKDSETFNFTIQPSSALDRLPTFAPIGITRVK